MKYFIKILLLLVVYFTGLHAEKSCEFSLFTISTIEQGATISDVINKLSKECKYSILVKDKSAQTLLKKELPSLYLNEVDLGDIFEVVLGESGLNYEFDGDMLKISYLVTKTFSVDFISTSRAGESKTKIVLSGEKVSSGSNSNSNSGGDETSQGNSKTEINSKDGFDFWEENLVNEISGILNRPEDLEGDVNTSIGTNTNGNIIINKSAGLITVTGSKKQVDRVEKYIGTLMDRLKNQVMIDVSILNVKHSKSTNTGINWKKFSATFNTNSGQRYSETDTFSYENPFSFTTAGWDVSLDVIVEFLEGYGDVSSVSNPKVLTLNNQPSLISVGSIFYYKEIESEDDTTDTRTTTTTNISYTPLFVGVLLDITPSIYGDEIMLKINPTVTKTKGVNVDTQETALEEPPNLDSNQLSSIVKIKDGQKVILGGLISKSKSNDTNKVPLLGDLPLLGYAFKNQQLVDNTEEMVIVITPRIVRYDDKFSLKSLGYNNIEVNGSE